MQRSFPYQKALNLLIWTALFAVYISLSSIYLFLPPMLSVLYYAYYKNYIRQDLFALIAIVSMLLLFEAEKGFWFGSSILFIGFVSHYIMPRIEQITRCENCIKAVFVAFAYIAYWLFIWIANQIFLLSIPSIDWHVVLYMLIEYLLIVVFL